MLIKIKNKLRKAQGKIYGKYLGNIYGIYKEYRGAGGGVGRAPPLYQIRHIWGSYPCMLQHDGRILHHLIWIKTNKHNKRTYTHMFAQNRICAGK